MSRVVPEGTAMLSRTMVAQSFLEAAAAEASVKVQEVARFAAALLRDGAGVGAGMAAGIPTTEVAQRIVAARAADMNFTILVCDDQDLRNEDGATQQLSRKRNIYSKW